jgi:hypothetical protein
MSEVKYRESQNRFSKLLEKHETHCKMAFAPGVELEQDAAD